MNDLDKLLWSFIEGRRHFKLRYSEQCWYKIINVLVYEDQTRFDMPMSENMPSEVNSVNKGM